MKRTFVDIQISVEKKRGGFSARIHFRRFRLIENIGGSRSIDHMLEQIEAAILAKKHSLPIPNISFLWNNPSADEWKKVSKLSIDVAMELLQRMAH